MSETATNKILIRVHSHRARRKLKMLGILPRDAYFSFQRKGEYRWIFSHDTERALAITGVTTAKDKGDLIRCWS